MISVRGKLAYRIPEHMVAHIGDPLGYRIVTLGSRHESTCRIVIDFHFAVCPFLQFLAPRVEKRALLMGNGKPVGDFQDNLLFCCMALERTDE